MLPTLETASNSNIACNEAPTSSILSPQMFNILQNTAESPWWKWKYRHIYFFHFMHDMETLTHAGYITTSWCRKRFHITGYCERKPFVTDGFPLQRASNMLLGYLFWTNFWSASHSSHHHALVCHNTVTIYVIMEWCKHIFDAIYTWYIAHVEVILKFITSF